MPCSSNCTFIGATFVETDHRTHVDDDFNYVGMMEADGTLQAPGDDRDGRRGSRSPTRRPESNNVRFHNCTFEGSVISDAPPAYTHVRNKMAFTGDHAVRDRRARRTSSDSEKEPCSSGARSSHPHYSVEMGTFDDPTNTSDEDLELTGTIVAGVLDMRGRIKVNGTILTTFEPESFVAPVIDENSPQFNTTLGYFSSAAGRPRSRAARTAGLGLIQVTVRPRTWLSRTGSISPIELRAVYVDVF